MASKTSPMTQQTPPTNRRKTMRVSGTRLLMVFGVLALLVGAALYWALVPLYTRGKDGLRVTPPDAAESVKNSTE